MHNIIKKVWNYFHKHIIVKLVILKKRLEVFVAYIRFKLETQSQQQVNYYDIPIIINNYNRLNCLMMLIKSLVSRGYSNIFIIDNASTYPPLLEYYENCPYTVFRLNRNIGYKALWETEIYDRFKQNYYVYTDPDVQIDETCPADFMEYFVRILNTYPSCQKVGFGIRIDDLPDSYHNKSKVIEWETQFWRDEVKPGLYRASIDTTFALYRPYCGGEADGYHKVFRTGAPFVIRHLPWYNLESLIEEDKYYLSTIRTSTHWSQQSS